MERGSDELRKRWGRGGFTLDDDVMEGLMDAMSDFVIDDILIKGQPRPDVLSASFDVDGVEPCGNGIMSILKVIEKLGIGRAGGIRVFPKGIPADKFTIQLEIGR
jgi:hypothetical protein